MEVLLKQDAFKEIVYPKLKLSASHLACGDFRNIIIYLHFLKSL